MENLLPEFTAPLENVQELVRTSLGDVGFGQVCVCGSFEEEVSAAKTEGGSERRERSQCSVVVDNVNLADPSEGKWQLRLANGS